MWTSSFRTGFQSWSRRVTLWYTEPTNLYRDTILGFGFKYHVVTVAAIFFALTVGLVVGSLLLSPKVADQQAKQIKKLGDVVTNDFKLNKAQKDTADKALAAIVPAAVKGKLLGVPVAIVQTGNYPDAASEAREALLQAGARIVSVTTIDHEMDRPNDLLEPALAALNKSDGRFPTDRSSLAQQMASIICRGDSSPSSLLPTLEHENYMHAESGTKYDPPGAHVVIIVAGSQPEGSDRVINVDQPLIAALQKLGAEVLMCEPSDAHVSDVDAYRLNKIGVTTIDNIDDPIGHGSLVFAIGGVVGDVGDYGVKPTANAIYPPELLRYSAR